MIPVPSKSWRLVDICGLIWIPRKDGRHHCHSTGLAGYQWWVIQVSSYVSSITRIKTSRYFNADRTCIQCSLNTPITRKTGTRRQPVNVTLMASLSSCVVSQLMWGSVVGEVPFAKVGRWVKTKKKHPASPHGRLLSMRRIGTPRQDWVNSYRPREMVNMIFFLYSSTRHDFLDLRNCSGTRICVRWKVKFVLFLIGGNVSSETLECDTYVYTETFQVVIVISAFRLW